MSVADPRKRALLTGAGKSILVSQMPAQAPFISIVVPVYNEEDPLPKFLKTVREVLAGLGEEHEIIFAADPGTDRTLDLIRAEHARDPRVKMLLFSRRFGQPAATLAGLHYASGQVAVVLDCDLQDPPALIPEMLAQWRRGYKVVIPQRRSRKGENLLKRLIAYTGYWFINRIASVPIPRNTGDFRLLDRRVVNELKKLSETHGFLRGLVSLVGFNTYLLPFDRDARAAGQGKYNRLTGSLRIGFNGVIAFSDYLLSAMTVLGCGMAGLALLLAVVAACLKWTQVCDFAPGIPSLMLLLLFLAGVQLAGMGILGAYIGRIYDESKRRPQFIVAEALGFETFTTETQIQNPKSSVSPS